MYCETCGKPLTENEHSVCRARQEINPPRFCGRCRRRMVVQITPTGWAARCGVHGERQSPATT
ncbi:biotin synthase auxiliary protein BsaP [Allokutzneria oryzae]|uniref:biotin synthase auxiliary protein BsaP n=1 Tax=Allokutzneria oryzae TaxID=1378989 RepID=UPI00406BB874